MNNFIGSSAEYTLENVEFNHVLNSWINGQLATATRRAYLKELLAFFSWLCGKKMCDLDDISNKNLQSVRINNIIEYRNFLSTNKAPSTAARSISALKSLFKYLVALGVIDKNPTDSVKLPKVPQESNTFALNQQEIEIMINCVETIKNPLKRARDRLILLLLFVNGLRRSEVCCIKFNDFDRQGEYDILRVHSKGGNIDVTKVKPIVKAALNSYINELKANAILPAFEGYLLKNVSNNGLVSHEKDGISSNAIYLLFKKYALLAGLPADIIKKLHPHSARHSAITIVVDHAGVHKAVQFARHSDPKTTMRYYRRKKDLNVHGTDFINYDISFSG